MRVVWLKRDAAVRQVPLLPSGKLMLDLLAARWKLDPDSVETGNILLERDSHGHSLLTLDEIASLSPPGNNGLSEQTPLLITDWKSAAVAERHQVQLTRAEEFSALAAAVPPFSWPAGSEPSKDTLQEYLLDFSCLAGRVPLVIEESWDRLDGLEKSPFFSSKSDLAHVVGHAILMSVNGLGEQIVNSRLLRFCEILDALRLASSGADRLNYQLSMDRATTASSTSSTQTSRCGKRKRPDFLFEIQEFLFLFGEGKADESQFALACNEINQKLLKAGWVFGEVKFVLAFAVAGYKFQLFVKRDSGDTPEPLGNVFDMSVIDDRVKLALLFIKLYFVCLGMCSRHMSTGMLPLFRKHKRDLSTVQLDGEGCVKVIPGWSVYKARFGVALTDIIKAYNLKVPQLPFAVVEPSVSEGKYSVRSAPLGFPAKAALGSVEQRKQLARDLLTALAALHEAELVHRDIRMDNVLWSPDMNCFVLIDLEMVCKPGKKMSEMLRGYNGLTLVDGKYTRTSDLYQLGVLIWGLAPQSQSQDWEGFVNRLQSHDAGCTARGMLSDAWLTA